MRFSQSTGLLMPLSSEILSPIIRIGLSILVEVINLVNSVMIFFISNDLTQMVNVSTLTPDYDSHSPALLDLFLSCVDSICSKIAFPPLGNSDYAFVSVSIDFPSKLQREAPFHGVPYDYYRAYWDGPFDHWKDAPWEDILTLGASGTASAFCEWVQVGIDIYIYIYISQKKYQIDPHSSPWFARIE